MESTCLNFHLPLIFDLVISIFEKVTLIFNNINIHFICRQFYKGSSNMSFEGTQFLQKYSLDKRLYNSEYNLAVHPIVPFVVG